MGWAVGWDYTHRRHIGYGVPAVCDYPECGASIDRGLAYRCGDLYEDEGCGLYFCDDHMSYQLGPTAAENRGPYCDKCYEDNDDEFPPTPDTEEWATHVLTDESWAQWRQENPGQVEQYYATVAG